MVYDSNQIGNQPPSTSTSRLKKWAMLLSILTIIGLVVWFFMARSPEAPTVGLLERTAPDLHGLDQLTTTQGSCFSGYEFASGGRDGGGQQHYGLTFHLTDNPADEIALIKKLTEAACQTEAQTILDSVTEKLSLSEQRQVIESSYRAKNGERFILP